ncbi:hypothetical protein GF367_01055 [Candidatus Woesearchaeota archaeon]|nr:hypothetical protein [Candidatus Woesearchaeota archaeon]
MALILSPPGWVYPSWWKGYRKLRDHPLYHVSSKDDLVLDDSLFEERHGELLPGLPCYRSRPAKKSLRGGSSVYRLLVPKAVALRVAAVLIDDDDTCYTTYDYEVQPHHARWGWHALAPLQGLEEKIQEYEAKHDRSLSVILYSGRLAIVRDPAVVQQSEKIT